MRSDDSDEEWILEALASLDRPVMPEAVARRLDEAIAKASGPGLAAVPQQSTGPQLRSVKRRSWLIGVSGVAAATLALAVLNPFHSGTVPRPEQGAAPIAAGDAAESAVAQALIASQTAYTTQRLPQQVVEVARTTSAGDLQSPATAFNGPWAEVADQPAATTRGAAACVAALPSGREQLLYIDRARFEGSPVLVVARLVGTRIEVYVLGAGCTAANVNVLLRATVETP